jgi:hypothetical protein
LAFGVNKGDRGQTVDAIGSSHGSGNLQEALATDKVGLKARTERIATPGNAWSVQTGAAQYRVIEESTERGSWGQAGGDGAARHGEDVAQGKAILREESIGGGPILKLGTGSSEHAGNGVATEAKQGTQGEGSGSVGEALLEERRAAVVPELLELREDAGRVFFRAEGGGLRRRNANSALSSMIHSTVSPRENSMA